MADLFTASGAPVPLADQIGELKRELGQRRPVYRRLIEGGRLSQRQAEVQMDRLCAALATLQRLFDAGPR